LNRAKSDVNAASGRVVESISIHASARTLDTDRAFIAEAARAARCLAHRLVQDAGLADGAFRADEVVLAPRPG
jgi:hypothetical protein